MKFTFLQSNSGVIFRNIKEETLLKFHLLCRAAAERWDGEGALLFTSSSGVYDVRDNGLCDEVNPFFFIIKYL